MAFAVLIFSEGFKENHCHLPFEQSWPSLTGASQGFELEIPCEVQYVSASPLWSLLGPTGQDTQHKSPVLSFQALENSVIIKIIRRLYFVKSFTKSLSSWTFLFYFAKLWSLLGLTVQDTQHKSPVLSFQALENNFKK